MHVIFRKDGLVFTANYKIRLFCLRNASLNKNATPPMMNRFHAAMNDHCRWIVSASVFSVCAYSYSPTAATVAVPLFVTSAIASALVGKGLKRLLKVDRPAGAEDTDPGMPSSHAVSLWSLAVGALAGIHALDGFETAHRWATAAHQKWIADAMPSHIPSSAEARLGVWAVTVPTMVVIGMSTYWSYLRVRQGNHTPGQVLVGVGIGCAGGISAVVSNYAYYTGAHHGGRIDDPDTASDVVRIAMNTAFLVATWGFAFRYIRKWVARKKRGASVIRTTLPTSTS